MSEPEPDEPTQRVEDVDVPLLEALRARDLVLLRQHDRSVLTRWQGQPVLVACTDRDTLADWWEAQPDRDPEPPTVHELPFRQVVGLWASDSVQLLGVRVAPGSDVLDPLGA